MSVDIYDLDDLLRKKEIELNLNTRKVSQLKKDVKSSEDLINHLEEIKEVITEVSKASQEKVKEYVENTVTMALKSVFGDEYGGFEIEFKQNRNQIEARFLVEHKGNKLEPRQDTIAGGAVDICAFALQMVSWSFESDECLPLMILDEPFKNISAKYLQNAINMVKELCSLLNLQIIMVTHIAEFIDCADNVILIDGDNVDNMKKAIVIKPKRRKLKW
jgi:DNA repair exonuclease SbcCD ATPase subunit